MNKPLLLIAFTCMLWMGCKKQACDGVVCPANGRCIDGDCYSTCGPNQHEVGYTCQCDTGWVGYLCKIPKGRISGSYHVTGYYFDYMANTSTPLTVIDDTTDVVFNNDKIYFNGYNYTCSGCDNDRNEYYSFGWFNGSHSYSSLKFRRQPDDSLFYYSEVGGLGSGRVTSFKGVKIQ